MLRDGSVPTLLRSADLRAIRVDGVPVGQRDAARQTQPSDTDLPPGVPHMAGASPGLNAAEYQPWTAVRSIFTIVKSTPPSANNRHRRVEYGQYGSSAERGAPPSSALAVPYDARAEPHEM